MKKLLFTFTLALASIFTFSQNFSLDTYHAKLKFDVNHMTISNIDGEFKNFDIKLDASKPDFSDAKFTLTAETKSIDTGIEARDNHLKGADFFDVENYPNLKFTTATITKVKKNSYKLVGNLTLHGITKPVSLLVKYNGSVINPMSKETTYGFTITGSFKRSDFKIGESFPEAIISDNVNITSNLEFTSK